MGIHLHQPVGNFDSVFEQHMSDVYLPFITRVRDAGFLPLTFHVSGPLLDWMQAHDRRYLDTLGALVADGKVELLLAGYYEPVLASLPRPDRIEQIARMHEALHERFGVDARGLWLTERVWESELAGDLHDAGVRYALVDDRHFLVSGIARERLHGPLWTEGGGKRIALFSIDEHLRYLVPFQPPEDTVTYLRELRDAGHGMAVLADDGEKFGGWPGTREWVYEKGWLDRFFDAMRAPVEAGEVRLATFAEALDSVPSSGLVYLGTSSYREMEAWSLPTGAALRLERLTAELGEPRMAGPDGALVRGAHWRNFMVKYPEANRMHKKMLALSAICRARGNPRDAREAISRAQCNDAYWHGVFGGLYLPHLRDAVWRNLCEAARLLRAGEGLECEVLDLDCDGHDEIWVHSPEFSAVVSPRRGGAIEEWLHFGSGVNAANTLTRRREAYHRTGASATGPSDGSHTPSIHDIEHGARLPELPPVDLDDRAILVDRIVADDVDERAFRDAAYEPVRSWARASLAFAVSVSAERIAIAMHDAAGGFAKRLSFAVDGTVEVEWRWDPASAPAHAWFVTELSLACPVSPQTPEAPRRWTYDIETVAMSERGLDRTKQGVAEVRAWPASTGHASLILRRARSSP